MAGFVRECHNCTPQTCNEYFTCEDRKFRELRTSAKHPNGGDLQ